MMIRQAQTKDITELYRLAGLQGASKEEGYFERCLAEQEEGRRQVFVIRSAGEDVGYGMLNWRPQYALYRKLEIPEIQDLNVISPARRQGAASAIIAHCENIAREKGCAHIGISVGLDSGYGPAQRLYAKLGYIPDGQGITCDRQPVSFGEIRAIDDNLCLMLVKPLK